MAGRWIDFNGATPWWPATWRDGGWTRAGRADARRETPRRPPRDRRQPREDSSRQWSGDSHDGRGGFPQRRRSQTPKYRAQNFDERWQPSQHQRHQQTWKEQPLGPRDELASDLQRARRLAKKRCAALANAEKREHDVEDQEASAAAYLKAVQVRGDAARIDTAQRRTANAEAAEVEAALAKQLQDRADAPPHDVDMADDC